MLSLLTDMCIRPLALANVFALSPVFKMTKQVMKGSEDQRNKGQPTPYLRLTVAPI
ncbi:hypothetical protein [Marinomonas algicola]|uniref:hypothetical protein n=1 Tax=Marinomonas algicola TaxID=2773454 RepID=UPI0017493410|nr:hypothetical protein [Marinomonas algicola]